MDFSNSSQNEHTSNNKYDQDSLNGQCLIINLPNSCNNNILYEGLYSFKIWIAFTLKSDLTKNDKVNLYNKRNK